MKAGTFGGGTKYGTEISCSWVGIKACFNNFKYSYEFKIVKQGTSKYFTLAMKLEKKISLNWKKYPVGFKLGKKSSSSNSIFQTGELENSSSDR